MLDHTDVNGIPQFMRRLPPELVAAEPVGGEPVAAPQKLDVFAVGPHCRMLHDLAARAKVPGKIVLCGYGADGVAKRVRHFAIGDHLAMVLAVMNWQATVPGLNIYASFAILRPDLPDGSPPPRW